MRLDTPHSIVRFCHVVGAKFADEHNRARACGDGCTAVARAVAEALEQGGRMPDGQLRDLVSFAHDWFLGGFQRIEVPDKLGAALASTTFERAARGADELRMPWPAFVVGFQSATGLPIVLLRQGAKDGLGYSAAPEDRARLPASAIVLRASPSEGGRATDLRTSFARNAIDLLFERDASPGLPDPFSVYEARAVYGAIAMLYDEHGETTMREPARARLRLNRQGEPTQWIYKLTRPVTVDCREAVRAAIAGETSRTLSVQSLVCGHWRQQPCGPASSERKRIFIEPHWRGPDDAPIATRPHRIRE